MSSNLKIAIVIVAFIPLSLLLKKFFDNFENNQENKKVKPKEKKIKSLNSWAL